PSPGNELPLPRLPAARSSDAAAIRVGPPLPGGLAPPPGAGPEGDRVSYAEHRACRPPHRLQRSGGAGADPRDGRYAGPGGAAPFEWKVSRYGDQRRRRLQPLERARRHPVARRQHLRRPGNLLLYPRRGERRILVDGPSTDAQKTGAVR